MRVNTNVASPGFSALGRLALVAVVATFAAADATLAERACSETNPLMMCPVEECIALQASVNSICKNPAPVSCNRLSGCERLKREKQHWTRCALARDLINGRCWGGGDPGQEAEPEDGPAASDDGDAPER